MKTNFILLLTSDNTLEKLLAASLPDRRIQILKAENVDRALKIACDRHTDLSFGMIDFDEGCHGMTLLGAIGMLRADLPVVVVTGNDTYHAASLAYANGAAACLAKPFSVAELKLVLDDLSHIKLELAAA